VQWNFEGVRRKHDVPDMTVLRDECEHTALVALGTFILRL